MAPKINVSYIDEQLAAMKNEILSEQRDLINTLREDLIKERDERKDLEETVAMLRQQVKNLIHLQGKTESYCEQNEQYSRRVSLRIDNIPMAKNESSADCFSKVKKVLSDLDVNIPDVVIDRAHRVGKPTKTKKWGDNHTMIVRFSTYRHRSILYRARKGQHKYGIRLDLTSKRFALLRQTQDLVKEQGTKCKADFAFADINCQLNFRMKDGSFKYFTTFEQANDILCSNGPQ